MEYIKTVSDGPRECFLCHAAQHPEQDAANLVLARASLCLLILNRYPYVNGHLLIAPYRHVAELNEMTAEERAQVMDLAAHGQTLLQRTMNPQGFNFGINLGRCAGAGLPGHVHAHVVPRWNGDVNFMTVVGNVRIVPQALEESYRLLAEAHATLRDSV
jgi:ATP adenylyltransferase